MIRRNRHVHHFDQYVRRSCDGATLNWACRVEPCYSLTYRCLCGAEETTSGWLLPLVRFQADRDGWPLDAQGHRMRIAA